MTDTNASGSPNFLPTHLKLKGAENYASWKYHITDILGSKYLDEFILPDAAPRSVTVRATTRHTTAQAAAQAASQAEPAAIDQAGVLRTPAQIWKANDFKAKSIITANVHIEPSRIILKAKSASEAWEILRLKYEGKGLFLRMRYHSEFNSLRLADCESLLDYQIQFKELVQNLDEVGLPKPLEDICLQLILGVGDAFPIWTDKQRTKILAGEKLDIDDLFEELEDVSRVQELDKVKDQAIALFGRSKPPGQDQKQDKTKAREKTKKKCYECKRPGHIEKDCWIKHPELKPEKFKNRGTKRKADESTDALDAPDAKRPHAHVP
jgi:gag-polypeptide of LTR copia-type